MIKFTKMSLMILLAVSMFSVVFVLNVSASSHYLYRSPGSYYDDCSCWSYESNTYDDNIGTYADCISNNGNISLYVPSYAIDIYGFRIMGVCKGRPDFQADIDISFYSSSWQLVYSGLIPTTGWFYYNMSNPICDVSVVHISCNNMIRNFYLYEFDFLRISDKVPGIYGSLSNFPDGNDCYGLYPDINITFRDADVPEDLVMAQLWILGLKNSTYWMVDSDSGYYPNCNLFYDGSYFSRYGVEYQYKIVWCDSFNYSCQSNWSTQYRYFTILPCVLDENNANDTLPFEGDCWEMFGVCENISKWDLLVYNSSDDSYSTFNESVSDGDIYNGTFWYNSLNSSYDNVTDLYFKYGYWFYAYNESCWLIHNCTCPDIDESMHIDGYYNQSLHNESWVNFSYDSWFNDSSSDTLEIAFSLIDQFINHSSGSSGCLFPLYFNFSDENISCNITITDCSSSSLINSSVNETSWLWIAGFELSEQTFVLVLTGLFFWFAENKKDYILYVFTGIFASVGGFFYLGIEAYNIISFNTWAGIILMLFGVYCFFLSLRYSFMIRK